MSEILLALQRSVTTLGRGRVWFYFFAPALVALLLMVVFSAVALDRLVTQLAEQPPATWLTAWERIIATIVVCNILGGRFQALFGIVVFAYFEVIIFQIVVAHVLPHDIRIAD